MTDRRYPLHWPAGWRRRASRERPRYKVTERKALTDLVHSLNLLGARTIEISTNVPLRQDGFPYSNQKPPVDPGVAVYWSLSRKGGGTQECCMACDKWDTVAGNMRAVGMAVEALRQLTRCGASEILDRAFQGFAALPETTSPVNWRVELGFHLSELAVTEEQINVHYRARAKEAARNEEALLRLNQARDAALIEMGCKPDTQELNRQLGRAS